MKLQGGVKTYIVARIHNGNPIDMYTFPYTAKGKETAKKRFLSDVDGYMKNVKISDARREDKVMALSEDIDNNAFPVKHSFMMMWLSDNY